MMRAKEAQASPSVRQHPRNIQSSISGLESMFPLPLPDSQQQLNNHPSVNDEYNTGGAPPALMSSSGNQEQQQQQDSPPSQASPATDQNAVYTCLR
ncbi:hypothetical protein LXL04_033622 [Taraxacum kok-saghyz]